MVKEERDIVDRRLEETLDLFQPTARQEQAAQQAEAAAAGGRTRKSRKWDQDNPAFAYRIAAGDDDRISRWASELGATRDEVARGLIGAALEALDAGRLALAFERVTTIREVPAKTPKGKPTKRRIRTTETAVSWTWESGASGDLP